MKSPWVRDWQMISGEVAVDVALTDSILFL
jgi:hypothetical protein